MGFNGIQGSTVVSALGPAFAAKYNKTDDLTIVFMGDGTLGEGTCHESMNMAATWKLPIIDCLINNQYAISTRYTESHPQKQLATWADGYEVPNETVDGNDVEAVYEAVQRAAERARCGGGPTLLELMTYRWQGHFSGDPAAYRPDEEVAAWKARCPIALCKKTLMEEREVKAEELAALRGRPPIRKSPNAYVIRSRAPGRILNRPRRTSMPTWKRRIGNNGGKNTTFTKALNEALHQSDGSRSFCVHHRRGRGQDGRRLRRNPGDLAPMA